VRENTVKKIWAAKVADEVSAVRKTGVKAGKLPAY
jgi:hypothetical protein